MKLSELLHLKESTFDNITILRDISDIFLNKLPTIIEEDSRIDIQLDEYDIKSLLKKYEKTKYFDILTQLPKLKVTFFNNEKYKNISTMGAYIGPPYYIINIYVSAMTKSDNEKSKETLLSYKDNSDIKTIKSTLIHELRHFFQESMFFPHFSRTADHDYKTSSVEIDAAFMHHLEDYNIEEYDNVNDYINDVMKSFSSYKTLTPKQIKNYKSKIATYFMDIKGENKNHIFKNPKEELEKKYDEIAKNISNGLMFFGNSDIDLRKIQNYNADNFLIPNRIIKVVANHIISKEKLPNKINSGIFFLVAAYSGTKSDDIKKILNNKMGITLEDAISTVDKTFEKYDVDTIKQFLNDFYS